ncbi:MAG: hypothetical protein RLZZ458_3506 [Planctomycetota bacterium]
MSQPPVNPYQSPSQDEDAPSVRGVVYNPASPVASRIAQNMTRREKRAAGVRFGAFGAWMGVSFAVPFSQTLAQIHRGQVVSLTSAICGVLMLLFLASIPLLLRRQSIFLCSTQYARRQGIRPEDL